MSDGTRWHCEDLIGDADRVVESRDEALRLASRGDYCVTPYRPPFICPKPEIQTKDPA